MTIKLFIIRPFQERHDGRLDLLYGIFTAGGENGLTNGIEISPKGILKPRHHIRFAVFRTEDRKPPR